MAVDWSRVQEVFLTAGQLPDEQQPACLDVVCAGDSELRREVEALLASDRKEGAAITSAIGQAARELLRDDPFLGVRLGHWRIARELGRGGMGVVYYAIRDDDFQQHAAVKVVKYGMDTAAVLARFRHERQILANLDHPYIARLIDGGSAPDGRPYLVMEHVDGQPISAWRIERILNVDDTCRLFLKVCAAVSYAHRNLVVHRDLKPGNILITADGLPKLLDFGIARLLTPDSEGDGSTTLNGPQPITPDYASPEQVLGKRVTTASDIYSLGAVLYELLSGARARRLGAATPAEIERIVGQTEVSPPSSAVPDSTPAAARLRRTLAGDLDNIVLMAMRREPERRYASVDQFAADIEGYLERRPVLARRDSAAYRAGRFVRRHWIGVSLATLACGSILAGAWLSFWASRRTEQALQLAEQRRHATVEALQTAEREHAVAESQRDAAMRERSRAEAEAGRAQRRLGDIVSLAHHWLFDIHSHVERLPGATEARREIVKATVAYLAELSKEAAQDESLRQTLATAYLRLGDVQGYPYGPSLGDRAGALASYTSAEELLAHLLKSRPADATTLGEWVEAQRRIATLEAQGGKSEEGAGRLRRVLPQAARLRRMAPNDPEAAGREALLCTSLAAILEGRDASQSLAWSQRALALLDPLAVRFARSESILEQSADAHCRVGVIYNSLGRMREAMPALRGCADLRERLVEARPNDTVRLRQLMMVYGHIGSVLGNPLVPNLGDSDGARRYFTKTVALAERLAKADPRNNTAQYDYAAAMLRLGVVAVPDSEARESLQTLHSVSEKLAAIVRASPTDVRYRSQLAIAQEYIGRRLCQLRNTTEGIASLRESLTTAEAILATDKTYRSAFVQIVASTTALISALASSGDRAAALDAGRAVLIRAEGCEGRFRDRGGCASYRARIWLALASAHQIFAGASPAPPQSQLESREAQTAAERAAQAITAIPEAERSQFLERLLKQAQDLVRECSTASPASQ